MRAQLTKQTGVVLFIAMVALVVMSLAAAALIRSVDTNTKIAGNLAFKQSTLMAADRGVEAAITWLDSRNLAALNDSDVSGKRYFSTYGDLDNSGTRESKVGNLDDTTTLKSDATWNAYAVNATGTGLSSGKDSNNNTIQYIIERMCEQAGEPARDTTNKCLLAASDGGGDGHENVDNTGAETLNLEDAVNPMYRITVRVSDPKNTESYTQVYVY